MKSNILRKKLIVLLRNKRNRQRPSLSKLPKLRKKRSSSLSKMLNKKSENIQFSTSLLTLNKITFRTLSSTSLAVKQVKPSNKLLKHLRRLTKL